MALRNTTEGWGWLARLFHWVMGLMIIGLLTVGIYMVEVLGDDSDSLLLRLELTQTHKSFGFVVFVMVLARLIWRVLNPTPKLPTGMNKLEVALAHSGHAALYIAMIGMPLTGWLMSSASPFNDADAYIRIPNMVFGLFELPDPYPKGSEEVTEFWGSIHGAMGWALAIVLLGHIGAALKHHFVNKDTVLRRMIRG